MVMARHWYSSSPVVEGHPLLDESGFLPAYVANLAEGFTLEPFASDVDAMLETLHDPSTWHIFTVPPAIGFAIVVHVNSGEEFTTTDYFLTHPD